MKIKAATLDDHYLIIAGTSKAGTTSVFNYLAGHPRICASQSKETRFFLDPQYPLPSKRRYERDGVSAYLHFFANARNKNKQKVLKLEATPDYLYSSGTPRSIQIALPNVRFVFFLRKPLSRLISFYHFGKQIGELPAKLDFNQYVDLQRLAAEANRPDEMRHPVFSALVHGRYSMYLTRFLDLFDRSAIHVAFFEELTRDPLAVMKSLSAWAGIEEEYFRDFSFDVANKGVKLRSPRINRIFSKLRQSARRLVRHQRRWHSVLGTVGNKVNAIYRQMNVMSHDDIDMSHPTSEFLNEYFQDEGARLERLLGVQVPWGRGVNSQEH